MEERERLLTIYFCEQNLLKSCAEKLISSSCEDMHDGVLGIFDSVDEINRVIYNYLLDNGMLKRNNVSKRKKELLYEELDELLLNVG